MKLRLKFFVANLYEAFSFIYFISWGYDKPCICSEADQQAVTNLPTISVKADKEISLKQEVGQASSATKGLMQLKDVPQIVNVVPKQVLREQTVTSMQGALQNVAGLSFSVGDGQRDQVMIRGFSAITDNYVDGIRDDALYFRDMSNVERIEVLKGPASVLYGRGSAGGLVNKINKNQSINLCVK